MAWIHLGLPRSSELHLEHSILSFNKLRSHAWRIDILGWAAAEGRPTGDLVSYPASLKIQPQPNHQPIEQLVIQIQSVRDLVGFDEHAIGLLVVAIVSGAATVWTIARVVRRTLEDF
jgi:hypothetical protein